MSRIWILIVALALGGVTGPVQAQDKETLADIRQELTYLYVEIQRLRQQLSTTGGVGQTIGGATALERLNLIEGELMHLTARTEEMQNHIERIVRDGTNRIGDLEFRLVELEGGDISNLGETTTLGGGESIDFPVVSPGPSDDGGSFAVGEYADFDRAMAQYQGGDFGGSEAAFGQFVQTYTSGPLTGEAHYWRGEALMRTGQIASAARAFLDSFSGFPEGAEAPNALLGLGVSLAELNQVNEACIALRQVPVRYPGAMAVSKALAKVNELNCP